MKEKDDERVSKVKVVQYPRMRAGHKPPNILDVKIPRHSEYPRMRAGYQVDFMTRLNAAAVSGKAENRPPKPHSGKAEARPKGGSRAEAPKPKGVKIIPRGSVVRIVAGRFKGYEGVVERFSIYGMSINAYSPTHKNIFLSMDWLLSEKGRRGIHVIKGPPPKKKKVKNVDVTTEGGREPTDFENKLFGENESDDDDTEKEISGYGEDLVENDADDAEDFGVGYKEFSHGDVLTNEDGEIEYQVVGGKVDKDGNVIKAGKVVGRFKAAKKPNITPIQEFIMILTSESAIRFLVPENVKNDIYDMQKFLISKDIDGYDENIRNAVIVARLIIYFNNIDFQHVNGTLKLRCGKKGVHIFSNSEFCSCVAKLYGFVKNLKPKTSSKSILNISKERKERENQIKIIKNKHNKEINKNKRKLIAKELNKMRFALKEFEYEISNRYKDIMNVETLIANLVEMFKKEYSLVMEDLVPVIRKEVRNKKTGGASGRIRKGKSPLLYVPSSFVDIGPRRKREGGMEKYKMPIVLNPMTYKERRQHLLMSPKPPRSKKKIIKIKKKV